MFETAFNGRRSKATHVVLKRFTSGLLLLVGLGLSVQAQQVTVDITPGHSTNSFSPLRSLGARIDRDPLNSVQILYGTTDVQQMLTAGWGPISYRLNTELSIQAWHWNPHHSVGDRRPQARHPRLPRRQTQPVGNLSRSLASSPQSSPAIRTLILRRARLLPGPLSPREIEASAPS